MPGHTSIDAIRKARGLPPLSSYPVDNFGLPIVPPAPAPPPTRPSLASISRSQVVAPPPPSPYTAPPPASPSLASISQASSGSVLSKPAQDLANWINNDRLAVGASVTQIIVEMVNETKAKTVAEFLTALTNTYGISLEEFSTVMEDAGITPKDMVEGANAAKLPVEEAWIRETGANIGGFSQGGLTPPPEAPSPFGGSPGTQLGGPPAGGTTGEPPGGVAPGQEPPAGKPMGWLRWGGKNYNFDDQGNIFDVTGTWIATVDKNHVIRDRNGKEIGSVQLSPDGISGIVTIKWNGEEVEGNWLLSDSLVPPWGDPSKDPPGELGDRPEPFFADPGVIKGWLDEMSPDFDKVKLSAVQEEAFTEESKNRKDQAIATLGRLRKRARQDLREELNERGLTLGEGSQIENRLGFFESDMAFLETQRLRDIEIDIGARRTDSLEKAFDRELASFEATNKFLLGVGDVWQTQEHLAQTWSRIWIDWYVNTEKLSIDKATLEVEARLRALGIKRDLAIEASRVAGETMEQTDEQIRWETRFLTNTALASADQQEQALWRRTLIKLAKGEKLDADQERAADRIMKALASKDKEEQEGWAESLADGLNIGEFLSGNDILNLAVKGVKLGAGILAGGPAGGAATTMVSRAEPPPRTATVELPSTRPSLASVTPTPTAPALAPGVRQMTSASRMGQPSLASITQPPPPITTTLPSQPTTGLAAITGRTGYTGTAVAPALLKPSLSMFAETSPTISPQQKKPKLTGLAAFTKFL